MKQRFVQDSDLCIYTGLGMYRGEKINPLLTKLMKKILKKQNTIWSLQKNSLKLILREREQCQIYAEDYSVASKFSLANTGSEVFCLLLIQVLEVEKKGRELKVVTKDSLSTLEGKSWRQTSFGSHLGWLPFQRETWTTERYVVHFGQLQIPTETVINEMLRNPTDCGT